MLRDVFKNSLLFAAKDKGVFVPAPILPSEARKKNKKGYGIFFTVQGFTGHSRRNEDINNINSWMVDMDSGTKSEQLERIRSSPLVPSMIVETKNGHHVYWFASDATVKNFEQIEINLCDRFKGDRNAKDLSRVLRVPGFYHMKDPEDPFMVTRIYFKNKRYTEREMMFFFQPKPKMKFKTVYEKNFTGKAFDEIDNRQALLSLSGSQYINGDTIELKQNSNGTEQIWVNGKSTACWIDKNNRIGSHDKGGPTIFQWINWYLHDNKQTAAIVRRLF